MPFQTTTIELVVVFFYNILQLFFTESENDNMYNQMAEFPELQDIKTGETLQLGLVQAEMAKRTTIIDIYTFLLSKFLTRKKRR